MQRNLNYAIRRCKNSYIRRLEKHLGQNNVQNVWRGLKQMSDHSLEGDSCKASGDQTCEQELNLIFNRFHLVGSLPLPHSARPCFTPPRASHALK